MGWLDAAGSHKLILAELSPKGGQFETTAMSKGMATHPVYLPGESHGRRNLEG